MLQVLHLPAAHGENSGRARGYFLTENAGVKSPHWSKYLVVAKKAKAKEFWRLMQTVNHECLTYILLYHCPTVRCP